MIGQYSIISIYEYLVCYCRLEEGVAFACCNYSHEKLQHVLQDRKIERFPIAYYQAELAQLGIVLWITDHVGRTIPYINPMLLKNRTKEEIIRRLSMGKDPKNMVEEILLKTETLITPISFAPEISGYTRKKSYQKLINKERND